MAIRTYADTSVHGGLHDEEFAEDSRQFFDRVRAGRFSLITSAVVDEELEEAPQRVRSDYEALLPRTTVADITDEALELQEAYLNAGILTPTWEDDALHIALATVHGCELIVSWNFKHIVHFQKIPQYNALNTLHGYDKIAVHSPPEVISDDDEPEK
jgi:predicted nucleic acid-binding protein